MQVEWKCNSVHLPTSSACKFSQNKAQSKQLVFIHEIIFNLQIAEFDIQHQREKFSFKYKQIRIFFTLEVVNALFSFSKFVLNTQTTVAGFLFLWFNNKKKKTKIGENKQTCLISRSLTNILIKI